MTPKEIAKARESLDHLNKRRGEVKAEIARLCQGRHPNNILLQPLKRENLQIKQRQAELRKKLNNDVAPRVVGRLPERSVAQAGTL